MKETSKVRLTYHCPIDLDSMPCSEKGKFCTQCSKNVTDFRNKEMSEIEVSSGDACGQFDIYQVENPFNNWKDNFVRFSERMYNVKSRFKPVKRIAFALSVSSLFLIGCSNKHRTVGAYAYGNYNPKNEKRQEVKKQEKDDSEKTIREAH